MYRLIAKLTRRIVLAIPYPHTTSSNRASVMKHIPRVLATSTVLFVNGIRAAEPIDVGSHKQLFLDGLFLAEAQDVSLKIQQPQKTGEVILRPEHAWESA